MHCHNVNYKISISWWGQSFEFEWFVSNVDSFQFVIFYLDLIYCSVSLFIVACVSVCFCVSLSVWWTCRTEKWRDCFLMEWESGWAKRRMTWRRIDWDVQMDDEGAREEEVWKKMRKESERTIINEMSS